MEQEIKKYIIEFDYNYLDRINEILSNDQIILRSFNKKVKYYIQLKDDTANTLLSLIYSLTYGNIKIQELNVKEELQEVGTDKPIGSKQAIDEN